MKDGKSSLSSRMCGVCAYFRLLEEKALYVSRKGYDLMEKLAFFSAGVSVLVAVLWIRNFLDSLR